MIIRALVDKLGEGQLTTLKQHLSDIGILRIGSACSGSNITGTTLYYLCGFLGGRGDSRVLHVRT
eukprot:4815496-Alexandrium_andersonii.AAC.1